MEDESAIHIIETALGGKACFCSPEKISGTGDEVACWGDTRNKFTGNQNETADESFKYSGVNEKSGDGCPFSWTLDTRQSSRLNHVWACNFEKECL